MKHPALPQRFTPEKLGQWISENQIERRTHIDEIQLTGEQIHEFEAKVANTTAAIYDLMDIEKAFKSVIKLGTGMKDDLRQPQDFTIPPTKGTKELEANRKHYDGILKKGFTEEETPLFGIPYPEDDVIVFFDIEGKEYEGYTTPMNEAQKVNYGKLFDDSASPLSL